MTRTYQLARAAAPFTAALTLAALLGLLAACGQKTPEPSAQGSAPDASQVTAQPAATPAAASQPAPADPTATAAAPASPTAQPGTQKSCPVMAGAIDPALYVDVGGKRIYVCCGGCKGAVLKDPAKYVKLLEEKGEKVQVL